jgi:hypothetical protein
VKIQQLLEGSPSKFSAPTIDFKALSDLPAKPHTSLEVLQAMLVLHKMIHAQTVAYGGEHSKLLPAGITK